MHLFLARGYSLVRGSFSIAQSNDQHLFPYTGGFGSMLRDRAFVKHVKA